MKSSEIPKFGPLAGVNVVCAGMATAGPFAASLMADFGGNVVFVESTLAKDSSRAAAGACWEQDRRNMRTIALNTPSPEGKEVFLKLLKDADIFIENSKGGQYAGWGLTDEVLWEANPALVIVHVSGFGQTGVPEYIKRPSWDPIGQAFGTIVAFNGTEESPMPTNPFMCDMTTALYASWGALAALFRARQTGKGESLDIAQFEVMLRGQSGEPLKAIKTGIQPKRTGQDHSFAGAYRPFKCKDGFVYIAFGGPGIMKVGLPFFGFEFGSDLFPKTIPWVQKGSEGCRLLEAKIEEYCADKTAAEIDYELSALGVPVSPIMTYEAAYRNPHYQAREVFTEWERVNGEKVTGVNILPKMKNEPGQIWRGAPEYGMDNDDILEELGYTPEQIKELYEKRVLAKE